MQAQNAMSLMNIAASPILQPLTDVPELYRRVVTSMQLDPNEIVKTDAEIAQAQQMMEQQQQAMMQQQQQGDPLGQAHLQLKQQQMQVESQLKQQGMSDTKEIAMAKLQQAEGASQRDAQIRMHSEQSKVDAGGRKVGVDMMRENNRRLEMGLKKKMGSGI
jgi:hypothetical protein